MKNRFLSFILVIMIFLSSEKILIENHVKASGVDNITARADYLYSLTWTAQADLNGYKNSDGILTKSYKKGGVYKIPYGMPVNNGVFIGYGISPEDFIEATKSASNPFYSKRATYKSTQSNYYSMDCSTFVSYCWNLPNRNTTRTFPQLNVTDCGKCTSSNVGKIQQGDALNLAESHIMLVSRVNSDGTYEITEQTPPEIKRTTYTASQLVSKYSSYTIYRYNNRDSVPAPPNFKNNFFDFWGVDEGITINGTYKLWFKQEGYGSGSNCDVNIHIDGKDAKNAIGTIYQDEGGFFSYSFDTTKYSNGKHTIYAVIRNASGEEKWVSRTVNIKNKFFDFWGVDEGITINGTYKLWFKQEGYGSGSNCDVNIHIDGKEGKNAIGTIYQDEGGFFSYSFDTTKYSNGKHTIYAVIRNVSGEEKWSSRTVNISNLDTTKPNIKSVSTTGVTNDSFKLVIVAEDNNGVKNVTVSTSSWKGTDQKTYNAVQKNATTWECTVKSSDFNNEHGAFYSTVCVYDYNGNKSVKSDLENKIGVYTVTFDANTGSVSPKSKTVVYGNTYDRGGKLPTPTKNGYVFAGWYTEKDGGTRITDSTKVTKTSNHTIYAHWTTKPIEKYKVTFDSNGGNAVNPASKEVTYNGTYGTLPAPTRTGHTFLDWYTAKTGGTKITAETKVTITANQILYARWKANNYKVTFDSNGGNAVNPEIKEVTYNGTYGTLPTPIKQNHKFLGWYTAKTGGTKITAETKVTITTNQTLYAQWSINKYKVTFDATGGVCTPVSKDVVSGNVYDTLPAPTRQDYTFLGWYTSKSGGTKITSETKVTITANQTLYAHWTQSKPSWDAYDFKGAGTADDPYQISSADELKELSKLVNNVYYNKVYGSAYYIQTKDIDLDNEEWIPIGYASESDKTTYNGDRLFKGFYDGQFHSVLNLNITDKFKYTGLFGRLSEGKIQNLKVEGKVNTTKNFVGGICGEITGNGIIEKCSFSGSVSGNNHVGGIAGKIYISGTVKNSNALAEVNGSDYGIGGCVGLIEMGGTIENVYHIGTVKNSVHLSTGGVLGRSMLSTTQPNDNIIIQNAYHIGEVTTAEGTVGCVGEIVGYAEDKDYTFILNCYCAKDANPGFNGSVAKADIQEISLNLIRFIAEDLGKPFVTNTNKDNNNGYPVFEWQIDEKTPVEPETVHGSGDVNNDGKTDLTDLTYLSLYLLGDVDFTQQQLKTIDINKDNKVDIADLPTLKMVIMKS